MRALWSGALTFGLINIPVKLYVGAESREIHFDLLHEKDHSPIRYARICRAEEKEVPWEEIVKGFEYEEGSYVVLTKEDFEAITVEREKTIDILGFVDEQEVDSSFYTKPYYLEAGKGASKAYVLLREALKASKRVGVAQFVFHNKEHLGIIKGSNDLLILNQIRYVHEFRAYGELKIPSAKISKMEMDMAMQLIDQLTIPFEPQKYHDAYTETLFKLIEDKARGRKIKKKKVREPAPAKVVDIMGLLKKSLDKDQKKRRKTA